MKRISFALTALVVSLGLAAPAQAATAKRTSTAKKCTCTPVKKATKKKAVRSTAKKPVAKKTTRRAAPRAVQPMTSEINPNIPADIKINEDTSRDQRPYATTPALTPQPKVTVVQPAVVPVRQVVQRAPASQVTTDRVVAPNTVQRTTTTTVPVDVQTVPVVVNP
ncbi:hypothetical protein [Faucicola atlantae]|uniref:hypothetical protein n=1 Tax=Faucicola atlantae TaxID=34059 RepID=UPI0025B0F27E|nr:hypothetical protein [Moraxella atlantae]